MSKATLQHNMRINQKNNSRDIYRVTQWIDEKVEGLNKKAGKTEKRD